MARLTIHVNDATLAAARASAGRKGTTLQAMLRDHFSALAAASDPASHAALQKNQRTDALG